ncbi:TPA: hypothetical protein ACGXMA_000723 [Bacillus cereus]|uniref:hypothetical protein n=1 Tax=Bacillus cereus group TaxID=86661 RepID=UPI00019FFB2C|nr:MULTISPECIES: hypothetical protein [Bacillus cereus group]AEW55314.1 Putative ESAT-secreted protein [Bacillus cereus F837/76]EEK56835.1 hypothetical protein bcere0004_19890 [Bacillus cereus BGSC 6E1]KXY91193.1 hypothetical protein AT280_12945 [Bacillus cereus]MCE7036715.1 hypothetical protein [Bacillus cereus]MCU4763059.1 hypothetical protein [Bacillus cereus]
MKYTLSQKEETVLQEKETKHFTYRYSYVRAKETQDLNEIGQDFLVFLDNGTSFVFALCDGVGLSFHGEIAAKFLGVKLVNLFDTCQESGLDITTLLNEQLNDWIEEASEEVSAFRLPEETPWLLRDVLEEKRKKGSEAMFIGGKIKLIPNQDKAQITIVTHGDSFVQLFQDKENCSNVMKFNRNIEKRWSTQRGIIGGELAVFSKTLSRQEANRIVIHSDGLVPLKQYNFEEVLKEIERAQNSPTSDDISFLDVSW